MKKVLWFSAVLFVIALGMRVSASAETKKIGNFKYEYDSAPNGNDVWITKITPVTGSDISTLKIPSKIDGNKVIKLGAKDDTDDYFQDNIFGMYILEEDSSLVPEQIVSDVAKIKKIILPSGLKELTPNCFHSIQKGKTISLPKTLEKDISALYNLQWKKVTINKGNKKYKMKSGCILSKRGKTFYSYLETKRSVKIPNGVKTIAEGALFLNDNLKVIYIPNGALSSGTVTNYSREDTRRVDWVIGVEYGENYDKVESTVRRILAADSRILNAPAPFVALHALDASSVNIVIRVWVKSSDYWGVYFDMNKTIYTVFNEEGIGFPFPQLTVHQAKD